jgi:hypothetical protein
LITLQDVSGTSPDVSSESMTPRYAKECSVKI